MTTTSARSAPLELALAESADWLDELAVNGPDLRIYAHLKVGHEGREFAETPTLAEAADVLVCVMGAARYRGWTIGDLADAVRAKTALNRTRSWAQEPDGTWQHIPGVSR